MVKKVLQIGYEPERDRLTWTAGTFTAARAWMCYYQIGSVGARGVQSPLSTTLKVGICLGALASPRLDCGPGRARTAKSKPASKETPAFSCFLYFYIAIKIDV